MRFSRHGFSLTLGLVLTAAVIAQAPAQYQVPPTAPPAPGQQPSSMEAAGQLIQESQNAFARVRDYSGMFYKQERINGQLLPEQTIELKIRQQPFSVHMKWIGPKNLAGQEACYVAGKNDNMLRAKASNGLAAAIGFVSIDPRSSRAMATNRHPITDAGLGHLLESMKRNYDLQRRLPPDQTSVTFAEYRFLNKPCIRLESTRPTNNGQFYAYRTVVYLDKETRLPVRVEAYDWPKAGGPQGGEMMECYSYVDMKFNVGLPDSTFAH